VKDASINIALEADII